MTALYNDLGTPLSKHPDCPKCGEDEIGSHFDTAWCCACGWRGSLEVLIRLVAELRRYGDARATLPK